MSEYLLSIAIGPVQDFIAAARRTRDLAYGSYLLSEVSKACARHLKTEHRATLIFPTPVRDSDLDQRSPFMAVNKLLVQVHADGETAMRAMAADCRRHVITYLAQNELDDALMKAEVTLRQDRISIDRAAARRHLESFSEFFAAWAELLPGPDGYQKARETAESRMAARKTLRDFAQHEGKPGLLKSSLDGYRETVLQRRGDKSEKQYFVRPDEQLDGVGLLKRFGGNRQDLTFDSTSDVAAAPYVGHVRDAMKTVWADYCSFLEENKAVVPRSSAYLYPHASRQITDSELRAKLEAITQKLNDLRPETPYYGLLIGDGDNMGAALNDKPSQTGHQELSRRLSEFAQEMRRMFRDEFRDAECVYAGGDDVMALLPLHRALDYSLKVRDTFNGYMKKWSVTFSAGLVVAHALEPLDEVRRLAHEAERTAKGMEGKDALAIIVSPRSGANVQTAGKWNVLAPTLSKICKLYVSRQLSKGLGHELRALLARWEGDEEAKTLLDGALPGLAMAIAEKKEYSKEAQELVSPVRSRNDARFLVNSLFVARPFARSMREAGAK